MSSFRLTTVEEFEAATDRLLETGAKVGADSWQMRVKNQTPHCKLQKRRREVSAAVTHTALREGIFCVLRQEGQPPIQTMGVRSAIPCTRWHRMAIIR